MSDIDHYGKLQTYSLKDSLRRITLLLTLFNTYMVHSDVGSDIDIDAQSVQGPRTSFLSLRALYVRLDTSRVNEFEVKSGASKVRYRCHRNISKEQNRNVP